MAGVFVNCYVSPLSVSGVPFRISATNAGTFLISRASLRNDHLQKLALLVRNLTVFQNTGAALTSDLDEELAEIVGSYANPSLIEIANCENELYLTVSGSRNDIVADAHC